MALGASVARIRRDVMARTLHQVAGGIALGVAGALALARLSSSLLFELEPTDPITFAMTMALLLAVAILAAYAPAGRASRVSPLSALRGA